MSVAIFMKNGSHRKTGWHLNSIPVSTEDVSQNPMRGELREAQGIEGTGEILWHVILKEHEGARR